ncbi:MAG: peptidoglycan-binding protein [Rhodospirillales bacterium]|nr:peptidoglycan-binding protein [Rhodospirillales bacterium]
MFKPVAVLIPVLALSGCLSETTMGAGGGPATGAAGPGGATNASAQLETCSQPLGTIALVESTIPGLAQYGLSSPIPVLRLISQQSGCFMVVERGQAFSSMMQERQLMKSGEMRRDSNFGGGQIVAADLTLTPNIIFSGNTGGGGAGAALGAIPGWGGVIAGALAGSLKFTSAEAVLTMTDNRSGLQLAAASGSATARDINIGSALFGAGGGYAGAGGIAPTGTPRKARSSPRL